MYTNNTILSAYITNLGKYVEGELVGKWVNFPATNDEMQEVLREIGIDGIQYEEVFISDYESDIDGLCDCLGEYENLSTLNYLAAKVQDMDYSVEDLEAILEYGEYTGSAAEIISLLDQMDCFVLYRGIDNDYDLGEYLVTETGLLPNDDFLSRYFDYEAYGRDVQMEEGGMYISYGYIALIDTPCIDPLDEIPEEYRLRY